MSTPSMPTANHLTDEQISELVSTGEAGAPDLKLHLASCTECRGRLSETTNLLGLLRQLPDVEPPRDFRIGPRVLGGEPPRATRLARWYTYSRTFAASAAALFVVLMGADLALGPTQTSKGVAEAPLSPNLAAPAAQAPAPTSPAAKPAAKAPAAAARCAPAPAQSGATESLGTADHTANYGESLGAASQPTSPPQPGEQRAAARDAQPLPPPTISRLPPAGDWGPFRWAAFVAAMSALLAAIAAFALRARITRAIHD